MGRNFKHFFFMLRQEVLYIKMMNQHYFISCRATLFYNDIPIFIIQVSMAHVAEYEWKLLVFGCFLVVETFNMINYRF